MRQAIAVTATWSLETPHHLVAREWDGEFIVLNTLTGDTHLLGSVGSLVYRFLQRGPQSVDTLTAQIAAELEPADRADARAPIEATLLEFSRLGLIVPTPVESR